MLDTGAFVLLVVLALCLLATPVCSREDTWSLPLLEKARIIEANIVARHNILGLYPSQVEVPLDGRPVDDTTLGIGNIAHAVCWTANYLAGASYRYAFLKREEAPEAEIAAARARADELFEAVYRCQLVTGVRGLQARGYAIGHGESYEERWGADHSNDWHQGAGEYSGLRWRGSPSHHNYSDSIHGLGAYYDLAAEGPQKDRCREAIDALVSYWVDNNLKIQPLDPDAPGVPILGFTDGATPNLRVLMAVAGARVAYHATGKQKFKDCHDRLVDQYTLKGRTFQRSDRRRQGHDDAEHMYGHLDNLWRIEDDPELRAFYRTVAAALWQNHKDDAQSLFTYIQYAIDPESPNREKALADALRSLRTWPTDTTLFPVMNSIRPEIEKVGGMSKEPLPLNEAAWDNEYIWKGHLYGLDRWLSRSPVCVAVPAEDPFVMYACDTAGDIYQTRDDASSWRCISDDVPAPTRHLAACGRVRFLAAATDNGVYLTTTGGHTWQRLPLPADAGRARQVHFDPDSANVLYVVTDQGIYRSFDFGEKRTGQVWECLSQGLPRDAGVTYAVGLALGRTPALYAVLDEVVYTRRPGDAAWARGPALGPLEYTQRYPWLVVAPSNPQVAYTAFRTRAMDDRPRSLLTRTTDGGKTWSIDVATVLRKYSEGDLMSIFAAMVDAELSDLAVDPRDPNTLYAATRSGLLKSSDAGATWMRHAAGLDIPLATHVMVPRASESLFLGTPAGLYRSDDAGETWRFAQLRLQFDKNTRRQIGGAAYLDAYWLGRYYGFIDEETANTPPEDWK